ncbi:MAG: hypothetical protein N3G21_12915 [Candidatus Hydrogenedentes bacterium]|nr:hypothetical protein [Candidatus Hydrogenedentota bacterium]
MKISRRSFIESSIGSWLIISSCGSALGNMTRGPVRKYNVSVSIEALEREPDLIKVFIDAGVSEVWLGGFLYGHWYFTPESLAKWKNLIEKEGIEVGVINVPLGHPGDSLGSYSGEVPLTPPKHWSTALDHTGRNFAGTSLHSPACDENKDAIKKLKGVGVNRIFLDDDFRLAQAPGQIGGCYCEAHKRKFLTEYAYSDKDWGELIDSVSHRKFTKLLRDWIDFNCDLLSSCFVGLENSTAGIELGIMVMYMGSEKAGIRLDGYKNRMFRVGEGMFDDASFGSVKGKCNELFSVLFHRRFVSPENAYSETTAFPADKLSAKNMGAKLVVSTIADVRNTMFMSGLQHFPKTHWEVLPTYMKKQVEFHQKIAGSKLCGPLKLYWGERSRYISDDNPFSLFLAIGVPFEVVDKPKPEGWTFISDYDLEEIKKDYLSRCVARREYKGAVFIPESLDALFKFKQKIVGSLEDIPHIAENKPVVCAWYPERRKVLIWNLSENFERFTLQRGEKSSSVELSGLDSILLDDMTD